MHIFPEIVHYCHINYDPIQKAVRTPDHVVLFISIVESINELLQLQPSQILTPLSIRDMLNRYPGLTSTKLAQCFETFITEEQYTPKESPPYL